MRSLQRVTYVDDDSDIRLIVAFALRDVGGFEVRLCGGGADFLADLDTYSPQLLLLDLSMPGMDGWQTIAALRRHPRGATLPVVVISARRFAEEDESSADPYLIGRIVKPFDPLTLAGRLQELWAAHATPEA